MAKVTFEHGDTFRWANSQKLTLGYGVVVDPSKKTCLLFRGGQVTRMEQQNSTHTLVEGVQPFPPIMQLVYEELPRDLKLAVSTARTLILDFS